MKKIIFSLLFVVLLGLGISSCSHDYNMYDPNVVEQQITSNVNKIFGVEFPNTQDSRNLEK